MKLRICDGERERIVPASIEIVEQTFASGALLRAGTEITLADRERWLTAIVVDPSLAKGPVQAEMYLVSGEDRTEGTIGRMDRATAIRRFREFLLDGQRSDPTQSPSVPERTDSASPTC